MGYIFQIWRAICESPLRVLAGKIAGATSTARYSFVFTRIYPDTQFIICDNRGCCNGGGKPPALQVTLRYGAKTREKRFSRVWM